jgi:glutathione S-transferase
VGDSLSTADLAAFATIKGLRSGAWDYIDGKAIDQYPNLVAIYNTVEANEGVKSWYALREERKKATAS